MSENKYMDISLEEVSMILMAFDKLIQAGGLRLGDMTVIYPLITKLLARLPKSPEEKDPTAAIRTPDGTSGDTPFTIPVPIKKDGGDAN